MLWPSDDDVRKMLVARTHYGTKNLNFMMKDYVFRRNKEGVHIINLAKTWEKLVLAARIIVAIENPQDVIVIVDEAVHICSEAFSAQDVKRLDSLRDVFDNVNENGGALGMCLVFTDCTLARFRNGRGARFLGQFVGRMENHLNLGDRISMAYEIKPVLRAYGFDESLADAAFRIANESGKMRTLYKCIQLAEKVAKKKSVAVSAALLSDVFHQIDTGSHPDE